MDQPGLLDSGHRVSVLPPYRVDLPAVGSIPRLDPHAHDWRSARPRLLSASRIVAVRTFTAFCGRNSNFSVQDQSLVEMVIPDGPCHHVRSCYIWSGTAYRDDVHTYGSGHRFPGFWWESADMAGNDQLFTLLNACADRRQDHRFGRAFYTW